MPVPPSPLRRALPYLAAGTLISGAALWMLRRWRLPMRETAITLAAAAPSPLPAAAPSTDDDRPLQPIATGYGDIFHRRYQVDIANPSLTPAALIDAICADINRFSARELATFTRQAGEGAWQVGDRWMVYITGPWNGPVQVIQTEPTRFALATLEGHLEAGEIQFRVLESPTTPGALRFEIRSWARSKDRITDFFYNTLGISRAAQTALWTYFCMQAVEASGGQIIDAVRVTTGRIPDDTPLWQRYQPHFDRWRQTALNFDPTQREQFTGGNGWRIDEYSAGLPSEPPGDPLPDGAWQAACAVLRNYEFPDPGLITGIFLPDDALDERIMILRARFLVFSFVFGVKIVNVTDETRSDPQRGPARVWGYGYQTLEGHFEMGEIMFEIWKFISTGEIEFRVHAFSKVAHIDNPFYRVGFWMFGRKLQKHFSRTALTRMQQLVTARIAGLEQAAAHTDAIPDPAAPVQSLQANPQVAAAAEPILDAAADDADRTAAQSPPGSAPGG